MAATTTATTTVNDEMLYLAITPAATDSTSRAPLALSIRVATLKEALNTLVRPASALFFLILSAGILVITDRISPLPKISYPHIPTSRHPTPNQLRRATASLDCRGGRGSIADYVLVIYRLKRRYCMFGT